MVMMIVVMVQMKTQELEEDVRICVAVMTSSVVTAIGALHDTGSVMEIRTVLMELMRTQRNVSILLAVHHISPVRLQNVAYH
jgi:hypothetical protein